MNVTIAQKEEFQVCAKVEISWEKFDTLREKKIKEVIGKVQMDGFRPGKAPKHLIEAEYGKSIDQEVQDYLIEHTIEKIVKGKNLSVVDAPLITEIELLPNECFRYTFEVEVLPEFSPKTLDGMTIEKAIAQVTDQDVEDNLISFAKELGSWQVTDGPAKLGDKVIIDIEEIIEKSPEETIKEESTDLEVSNSAEVEKNAHSEKDIQIQLGDGEFIDALEKSLENLKVGDVIRLNLTFPKNYHHKKVAGRTVLVEVTVKEVSEAIPVPMDEKFVKEYDHKVANLDELRQIVRQELAKELNMALKNSFMKNIFEAAVKLNSVKAPKKLIEEQIKNQYLGYMRGRTNRRDAELFWPSYRDYISKFDDTTLKWATDVTKLKVLVVNATREWEIKADPDKVRDSIKLEASNYEDPEAVFEDLSNDEVILSKAEESVILEEIAEIFIKNATIKEVEKTLKEVMEPAENSDDEVDFTAIENKIADEMVQQ